MLETVSIDRVHPWEDNPRYNEESVNYLLTIIPRFGFLAPIVARKENGEIIAGHSRYAAAKALGMAEVPVHFVDLTEEEAHAAALADNRSNEMSEWDPNKLNALFAEDVSLAELLNFDFDLEEYQQQLADLEAADGMQDEEGDDGEEGDSEGEVTPQIQHAPPIAGVSTPRIQLADRDDIDLSGRSNHVIQRERPQQRQVLTKLDVPDTVWPSSNEFGIPDLVLEMQGTGFVQPFVPWGSVGRTTTMHGTWHFYVEDYRFNALWTDPSAIYNSACQAIVEPNISLDDAMPLAVVLYNIYRKRWIARWVQSVGVRVYVDVNVPTSLRKYNFLGVPKGWRSYCTRGYTFTIYDLEATYKDCVAHAGTKDIEFCVYGGGAAVEAECARLGFMHVAEARTVVREAYRG